MIRNPDVLKSTNYRYKLAISTLWKKTERGVQSTYLQIKQTVVGEISKAEFNKEYWKWKNL